MAGNAVDDMADDLVSAVAGVEAADLLSLVD
jgi:hypothetical protein